MTDTRDALRFAVYYRALATASFLVGGGIALVGIWLGLGDAIAVFLGSFLQDDAVDRTLAAANIRVTVVFVAVGVTIWQVGSAAAFYWTFTEALEAGPTGAADSETADRPGATEPRADGDPQQ